MEQVQVALNNARTYYMVSGIANAVAAVIGTGWVVIFGATTCGVGCVFIVFPAVNVVVLIFDFMAMSKLQEPPTPEVHSFLKLTSVLDIVACFAVVPLVMGVLNLQILGRPEIHGYFNAGGRAPGYPSPPPPPPAGSGDPGTEPSDGSPPQGGAG